MTPKEKLIIVLVIASLILSAVSLAVTFLDISGFSVVNKTVHYPGQAGTISLVVEKNSAMQEGVGRWKKTKIIG